MRAYTWKRAIKVVALVVGCVAVVAWFVAMANIGMAHRDQWYGCMDSGTKCSTDNGAGQDIYYQEA